MTDDAMETLVVESHAVTVPGDEVLVRKTAEDAAADVGFPAAACDELGVVATELATTVLKHAGGGDVDVVRIDDGERTGLRVESMDAGPGVEDVDLAFEDGVSTAGSLGKGLGAVNRLTDRVMMTSPGEPNAGTHVVADRWLRPAYESTVPCPLAFGAASRPRTVGEENGDSFVIQRWNDRALVGVIDGLGHGVPAHRATLRAKQYVDRHFDQPFEAIFEGADRACRGTRGVVMALARFDWTAGSVTFGSVGNVACSVDGPEDMSPIARRGVVGGNGPDPVVETFDWDPEYVLVLHSDGVSTRWDWTDCADIVDEPATVFARKHLARFGKDDDDSTVVAVTAADDEEGST